LNMSDPLRQCKYTRTLKLGNASHLQRCNGLHDAPVIFVWIASPSINSSMSTYIGMTTIEIHMMNGMVESQRVAALCLGGGHAWMRMAPHAETPSRRDSRAPRPAITAAKTRAQPDELPLRDVVRRKCMSGEKVGDDRSMLPGEQ